MRRTFTTLLRRLSKAGFKRDFALTAILPDWWDDTCWDDASLLPDVEFRVARFLGLSIETVRDPNQPLSTPLSEGARLRRVKDIDQDRLAPAIHAAIQVAGAVVRNLRATPVVTAPDADPAVWRAKMLPTGSPVTLENILTNLWGSGIPVVPIDCLPKPTFQGMACIVDGRPVVIVGHKNDEPSRVSFLLAHEAGHIAAGDCTPGHPVVDEEDELSDDSDIEKRADSYALRALSGQADVPLVEAYDFKSLANIASRVEAEQGVDAGLVIWSWARRNNNFATATLAAKALYIASGARRSLSEHFFSNVDFESASESDGALLRCIAGQTPT